MINRAKCKLCSSIIESFHSTDYVFCKCGEIYVDGGDALKCGAKGWSNFIRVDDEGNEILVKIKEKFSSLPQEQESKNSQNTQHKPSKKELLLLLDEMLKEVENIPQSAMSSYITLCDYGSLLMVLSALFRAED